MPDYDFHQLSPYDLEVLARDLLQESWGVAVESFKTGRDGGVDLRHAGSGGNVVVQIKHYAKTGFKGLLRDLKKEAIKVARLKPRRYVVVTSVSLSVQEKDQVVATIGPEYLVASDVLGREDLNNLLGRHPLIEQRHFKLWLASRAVLDRVLHNAAYTRSEFKVQQVHEQARRYVQSAAYPEAAQLLDDHRVVVISGPPGVGKTTLANLLLYEHLSRGFQAVLIQRDVRDAESVFDGANPQVFYFDDFMGATFLGARNQLTDGSERALLDFIAMVRSRPNARLILTTRDHIYEQAMGRSERLRHSDIDDLRVHLTLQSYSIGERAKILYNHLYFSGLTDSYQDEILRGDFYWTIIKHTKFNPRIVEWLSAFHRLKAIPVHDYRRFIEDLLRDPSEIWRHAYEREASDAGRSILLALFSLQGKTAVSALKLAFVPLHRERAVRYGFKSKPEDFSLALREMNGAFLKPDGMHGIEVIDPSVLDLLNAVVRSAPDNASDVFASAVTFDQVSTLWSFSKSPGSAAVKAELREAFDQHPGKLRELTLRPRKFALEGAVGFRGPTFERRLVVLADMLEGLGATGLPDLAEELSSRLLTEWETEGADFADAVEAIRKLEALPSHLVARLVPIVRSLRHALVDQARDACSSGELRELVDVLDLSERDAEAKTTLCSAYQQYWDNNFYEDLRSCQSSEQFDELASNLDFLGEALGFDVEPALDAVETAKAEFKETEDARVSFVQGKWKERLMDRHAEDRALSQMFESLRNDRS